MRISYPILFIALVLFAPAILPWIFTYVLYFVIDLGIAFYVSKRCKKIELISPILYLSLIMIVMNTINFLTGNCKPGNFLLGAMMAFFIYGMERCIFICRRERMLDRFIHKLSQIAIFVNLLSLAYLLLNWNKRKIDNYTFLFGSKFNMSYILLLGIVLYFVDRNKRSIRLTKVTTLMLLAYSVWFSWCLNCITAVILFLFLFIFVFLPCDKAKNYLRKPISLGIIIAIAGTFPFWNKFLLNIPVVQRIITDFFHRNIGLTGRIFIYSNIKDMISARLITGYGYGTRIVEETLGVGNSQNGMTEFVLRYGIIAAIAFSLSMISFLKISPKAQKNNSCIFFGMTLGMMIISMTEVVYDSMIFYFAVFMCYYLNLENNYELRFWKR